MSGKIEMSNMLIVKERKNKNKINKCELRLLQRRDNVAYEVRLIVTNVKTPFATTKR